MKRLKGLLIIMLSFFISTIYVNADTIINTQYGGSEYSEYYYLNNLPYQNVYVYKKDVENFEIIECSGRTSCYNEALSYYQNSGYQYYVIQVQIYPGNNYIRLILKLFNFGDNDRYYQHVSSNGNGRYKFYFSSTSGGSGETNFNYQVPLDAVTENGYAKSFYMVYDYNFNFKPSGQYALKGFYDNENDNIDNMIKIYTDEPLPKVKDLIEYSSWGDYEQDNLENYMEVNLNNYKYVILTLKDYNQTKAFSTNFQVKGQIGITPIYNFGQTSKDAITGSQVQDRCNLNYENYTSYPFYILQTDLQNNAVYVVKSCVENSSFKYDTTIFDITYITSENENNPTVTINGKNYNVIPYNDLPSTATKNEEDNYIPGESGSATDTGGLDSAIKNTQQKMSEIWNTFTYFTDFVGQLFSSLPAEIRTILLSAFIVAIILGLIKIFVN